MNLNDPTVLDLTVIKDHELPTLAPSLRSLALAIQYTRDNQAQQQTQLSELFGATPSKLTCRITSTEASIIELRRVLADVESHLETIPDTVSTAITPRTDALTERLDTLQNTLLHHATKLANLDARAPLLPSPKQHPPLPPLTGP